ncbi:MAG TPA: hypothetical protein VGN14_12285 [Candidatus Elarobacter sp.]
MSKLVGIVAPSNRPGSGAQLRELLPTEIALAQRNLTITYGTAVELEAAVAAYEEAIADLVEHGADIVHPAGAPPLLLGCEGETQLVRRWEDRYGVPIFTNGMSQVNALRALGVKRIAGATYFRGAVNARFASYYEQAGFEVLEMRGLDVDFQAVPSLDESDLRGFFADVVACNPGAAALLLIGPAWRRSLGIVSALEAAFGIPIVHHVAAQSWEIQNRCGIRRPRGGYGRLLATFPAPTTEAPASR